MSAEEVDPTGTVGDWWATAISDISPDVIRLRGEPIEKLMRERSFVDVLWMMVTGGNLSPARRRLLEAALVASVDHGPHAPSIASARMAVTCGVGLNSAIANGVNMLGDVHGGAGQQCVQLLIDTVAAGEEHEDLSTAAVAVIGIWREQSPYLPGFGHRFHRVDPRRQPMLDLLAEARASGVIDGRHVDAGLAIEKTLNANRTGRQIPINVDGVTAMVYAELGVEPELARGLFVLGRSVGILAHAWEQTRDGGRIKGPIPPSVSPHYTGP